MSSSQRTFIGKSEFDHLVEHGWVTVPDVLSDIQCSRALAGIADHMWQWDKDLVASNPSHWKPPNLPAGTRHGINRTAAHLQVLWDVRQNMSVVQTFADYWNLATGPAGWKDMVSSMDAFGFYLASSRKEGESDGYWAHTDHGLQEDAEPLGGMCLQGLVNLVDCTGPTDGGLVVWDRSHRAHRQFMMERKAEAENPDAVRKLRQNWYKLKDTAFTDEIEIDGRGYLSPGDPLCGSDLPVPMAGLRVGVPAGSMVLWYSKTFHQNKAPDRGGRDRAVVYVCMAPKSYLTKKDRRNRVSAWVQARMTSHWPAGNQVKMFPSVPWEYSAAKAAVAKERLSGLREEIPILDAIGISVLGFDPGKVEPQKRYLGPASTRKRRFRDGDGAASKAAKMASSSDDDLYDSTTDT